VTDFHHICTHNRYSIVDYGFDPLSDRSRDVAMATNFRVKSGKIGLFAFIRSHGIPK